MKKQMSLLLLLVLTLILSACGGESSPSASGDSSFREDLNIAMTAQPPTLDAAMTSSNVANGVAGHIFEQLFAMDENYEPTPELALSVDVSEDGLEYLFTLREGVKFHSGQTMDADDVVASMNRWLDISARAKTLLPGAHFERVEDKVKLSVEKATSDVMIILSSRTLFPAIMPKEVVESAGAEGVSEYIGTGPYKFSDWKQDQYIHLVRNEDYSEVDSPASGFAGKKQAPSKNLYFFFVSDHATRIAGIKTGEYDVAESLPVESYDELALLDDITLYSKASGSLNAFLNTKEGVLAELDMRQAILAAMDMNEIMHASYVGPEHFTLDPGFMNINQPQWAVKDGQDLYNQADPDRVKELLAKAGYEGETVTLLTTKDYQEMYSATIVLQEQLRQAGINAEVANFDFPSFMETKDDRSKWDIFITSNSYNIIPPQILAVNPDWAGFDEPRVAELLDAIRGASSPEEARERWGELQGFMYEFGAATVLGHYKSSMATTSQVEGFVYFDVPVYWNAAVKK